VKFGHKTSSKFILEFIPRRVVQLFAFAVIAYSGFLIALAMVVSFMWVASSYNNNNNNNNNNNIIPNSSANSSANNRRRGSRQRKTKQQQGDRQQKRIFSLLILMSSTIQLILTLIGYSSEIFLCICPRIGSLY
jgi:hypothetical protein